MTSWFCGSRIHGPRQASAYMTGQTLPWRNHDRFADGDAAVNVSAEGSWGLGSWRLGVSTRTTMGSTVSLVSRGAQMDESRLETIYLWTLPSQPRDEHVSLIRQREMRAAAADSCRELAVPQFVPDSVLVVSGFSRTADRRVSAFNNITPSISSGKPRVSMIPIPRPSVMPGMPCPKRRCGFICVAGSRNHARTSRVACREYSSRPV